MNKKILILSAAVGAGHLRAAEAVEKEFKERHPAAEVKNIDVLNYTNPLFRRLYGKAYLDMVNRMPEVLGWMYDSLDKPWENERRRLALDRLNTLPLIKFLKEYQPDLAVCTHFLPAEIISWLTAKGKISFPQTIVVTDFDAHALWLCHHYERYFVALDETKIHLAKIGIPQNKITVSGIPIDPIFSETKDKTAMRDKHGLDADKLTILVSAGGFGVGNVENLLFALSDLQIPGQEERNSDHLLEKGCAIKCNNLPVLSYKIDRLVNDENLFAAMKANVENLARPDAARDIVHHLTAMI